MSKVDWWMVVIAVVYTVAGVMILMAIGGII